MLRSRFKVTVIALESLLIRYQRIGFFNDAVYIQFLILQGGGLGIIKEFPYNRINAFRLGVHSLQVIGFFLLCYLLVYQQMQVAQNNPDGISDFVSYPCGQPADRGELFRLNDLLLRPLQFAVRVLKRVYMLLDLALFLLQAFSHSG